MKKRNIRLLCLALAVLTALSVTAYAAGGGGGGGSSAPSTYAAANVFSSNTTESGKTYTSATKDQSAIWINAGKVQLDNFTVNKSTNGTGGDSASFYGVGASVLCTGGSGYLSNGKITSSATGGAGAFAYGNGTLYLANTTINVTGNNSAGGIHVAGGGTLYAWNLNVTTSGGSSAAIRSDRGGGKMVIDGGTYTTQNGTSAIYCTADITVHNATLTAGKSEAINIEGKNTVRLFDCSLSGDMQATSLNDNKVWNVILYQSMSGDSTIGTSEFDMVGGSLTCKGGPVFYTTNTSSKFLLDGVTINRDSSTTYLLQCTGNSSSRTWGTAGSNGASCVFTARRQTLEGDVVYDSISTLDFYLLDGSKLTGAVTKNDTLNGGTSGKKTMNMYVESGSTWVVTGNSTVTGTLYNAGSIVDASGKTVTIKSSSKTYVTGTSSYTVTVGGYNTSVSTTDAIATPSWSTYEVENPFGGTTDPGTTDPDPVIPADAPYSDVTNASSWYYDAVKWGKEEGVVQGTSSTTFSPGNNCTRGMIVTFLWRYAGEPDPESMDSPFTDVADSRQYYYKAVLWAKEQGITNGKTETTFDPDGTCTRAEAVTFLYRYAEKPTPTTTTNPFGDVKNNAYYYDAVLWAVENGITAGTSDKTFEPGTSCNRAHIVTFLYRYDNSLTPQG